MTAHPLCPNCDGTGNCPHISTVSGEQFGWHDWPCSLCGGTGLDVPADEMADTDRAPPMTEETTP